jgi:hypothetical protein
MNDAADAREPLEEVRDLLTEREDAVVELQAAVGISTSADPLVLDQANSPHCGERGC